MNLNVKRKKTEHLQNSEQTLLQGRDFFFFWVGGGGGWGVAGAGRQMSP